MMRAMDSQLDEMQQLVESTFADFFRREVPITRVRQADDTAGFDAALWRAFCALGGERVATSTGGGTLIDAVIIGMEVGRRLAPIPYADVAAALRFADELGVDLGRADLPVVVDENDARADGLLSSMGAIADTVVLLRAGQAHVIPLEAGDDRRSERTNLGGLPLGRLRVESEQATTAVPHGAARVRWLDDTALFRAAVLIGAGEEALELACAHVRGRNQFGRPIGSFQALQHRLATCATSLRGAHLLVLRAACHTDADDRTYRVAIAGVAAADAAELAAREALQLFGGYGYSLEYDIHLYLRAIKAWRVLSRPAVLKEAVPGPRWGTRGGPT